MEPSQQRHLVSFHIGNRWEESIETCPYCSTFLHVDKIYRDRIVYKCLKCGYTDQREDNE